MDFADLKLALLLQLIHNPNTRPKVSPYRPVSLAGNLRIPKL